MFRGNVVTLEPNPKEKITNTLTKMMSRQGHIIYVNGQQIVGRMFGGFDIIYTDRQTVSLRHHKEGSAERLFPDR